MSEHLVLVVVGALATLMSGAVLTLLQLVAKKVDRNLDLLIQVKATQDQVLGRLDRMEGRLLDVEGLANRTSAEVQLLKHKAKYE